MSNGFESHNASLFELTKVQKRQKEEKELLPRTEAHNRAHHILSLVLRFLKGNQKIQ
jgi:hypothetical protein